MQAYLVIDIDIRDLPGFMEYAGRIPALIARDLDKHHEQPHSVGGWMQLMSGRDLPSTRPTEPERHR